MSGDSPDQLKQTLPATAAAVPRLRRAVAAFAAKAGASEECLEGIRLAVSEAVSNAVVHAYADRPESGPVHLTASVHGDTLSVTVTDAGNGMEPRLDSPGLGMWLPLIARSADTMDVHVIEAGGTEIRMSFRLARG